LAPEVNAAVEIAHTDGVLTAASLMVSGSAAEDAITRARRLPRLRVGLHLVLVEGAPKLPPERLPDLVDGSGRFRVDMAALGFAIFARKAVRRQVAAEIEAQFEAFRATGLQLDHVNTHKHYHLHPTIADLILTIGSRYGMRSLRVPIEPRTTLRTIEPNNRLPGDWTVAPWARLLSRIAGRAALRTPDAVFGLTWTGAMTRSRLAGLLQHLPGGLSEIYLHPATHDSFPGHAPGYRYKEELDALTSQAAITAVRQPGLALGGYGDF
jgi:hopanoid biosynthesis associated protein HpnK